MYMHWSEKAFSGQNFSFLFKKVRILVSNAQIVVFESPLSQNNRSSYGQLLKTFSSVAFKIQKEPLKEYFPLSNMMQFSFLIQIKFKS